MSYWRVWDKLFRSSLWRLGSNSSMKMKAMIFLEKSAGIVNSVRRVQSYVYWLVKAKTVWTDLANSFLLNAMKTDEAMNFANCSFGVNKQDLFSSKHAWFFEKKSKAPQLLCHDMAHPMTWAAYFITQRRGISRKNFEDGKAEERKLTAGVGVRTKNLKNSMMSAFKAKIGCTQSCNSDRSRSQQIQLFACHSSVWHGKFCTNNSISWR